MAGGGVGALGEVVRCEVRGVSRGIRDECGDENVDWQYSVTLFGENGRGCYVSVMGWLNGLLCYGVWTVTVIHVVYVGVWLVGASKVVTHLRSWCGRV